ncbi:hypothetical protein AMJ74_00180 [candidate division WOR_3 bacterium SM1_77]|uniref:Outer membrane protein assembly factor BamA n=1 Tax=candidate division WOR_3 bacterium SM1_77 TaxID=1703778 RepID=A0A0S8K2K5_UNCW3|nr:MAG: hypothetical protein AMJ74_00180 [candidate division WOR_3 bacterium SM1_77]
MIVIIIMLLNAVQFKVGNINIYGNQYFKESAIRRMMLTKTAGLFNRGEFIQEIFDGDIIAIEDHYNYNGFLEAKIAHDLTFDSTQKKVNIEINVAEGKQTLVENIIFAGNTLFTEDFLRQKMSMIPGEPFDSRKIDIDNYVITSLYDDIGYSEAQIKSDYTIAGNGADVTHNIIESTKQFIGGIEFEGLKNTQEDVLRREITLKLGDPFRYANILKSQRNLYTLGIFRSIRVQTKKSDRQNAKIIQFILTEKAPMVINFRVGYGTQDYLRLGAGFTHINMFGRAWRGQVESKVSLAEYRMSTSVTFPRLLMIPAKYSIGVFYQFKRAIHFETRSIGGYNEIHFDVAGGKLSTKYDIENIRTYFAISSTAEDDWLHRLILNWSRDNRDDFLFPERGSYLNINLETSGIILPSDVDYIRPTIEYRIFVPLSILVGASSLKLGLVQEVAPSTDVPVHKRYYCGGATSVRGYEEWGIGPRDNNGDPLGGRVLFEWSGEVRFPIYKIFGGAFFIDAGNVWREYRDINGTLRWGIGCGLRVKTPLGSIRLDYGLKVDRQPEESQGALHFAIGEAF